MENKNLLIGIRTDDYVILASDKSSCAPDALVDSKDHNNSVKLGGKLYMNCIGENSDVSRFSEWAQEDFRMKRTRYNGNYEISPKSAHEWLKNDIASGNWRVDCLLGGYDDKEGKAWLSCPSAGIGTQDYLVQGSNSQFYLTKLGMLYKKDTNLTEEQGLDILKQCSQSRFSQSQLNFNVLVIDKNGYRKFEL